MQGGCHCGALRYEVQAMPFDADFCHCRDCQKTTGSAVGVWMDFKVEQIDWLSGQLTEYVSSMSIRRGFCGHCGSTLSYRSIEHPDYFTLAITSLDEASRVALNPIIIFTRHNKLNG